MTTLYLGQVRTQAGHAGRETSGTLPGGGGAGTHPEHQERHHFCPPGSPGNERGQTSVVSGENLESQ